MPNKPPSSIKNKLKREAISRKRKKENGREKLQKRLAQAKAEANDPVAKRVNTERLAANIPRTLDNMREEESATAIESEPFSSYFSSTSDPCLPPKVLITTSTKATKVTYDFCEELVGVFPGADFFQRRKGKGFEMGRIARWAAERGYRHMCVVNEDMKKPNAMVLVYLPDGPTAHFKLTSIELTRQIFGHARATAHHPELLLNNFVTGLGHTVGRMFQTLFPPMPEFQGRQVVTLHNQRDFLFFRRHRYAFRSTEKVALQEIGPRFTLKLRSLKKGIPAVQNVGEVVNTLTLASEESDKGEIMNTPPTDGQKDNPELVQISKTVIVPNEDEFLWKWKPELEITRHTFFL